MPEALIDEVIFAWCTVQETFSMNFLSPVQYDEFNAFKSESRQREYVATRGLIKQMVETMDLNSEKFELQKNELGKPWGLYNDNEYRLSIAHTAGHVLCAISPERELGVDLEPTSREVPDQLRSRIINAQESSLLNDEPDIRIWTIKEAIVKLQGKGMRTNLIECTITAKNGRIFSATFDDDKKARICSFEHKNNWLAIAWNS